MRWALTLIGSALAAATGAMWKLSEHVGQIGTRLETIEQRGSPQFQETDKRLTRVEERQKHVVDKLDDVLKELRKHEDETRKP